MIKPLFHALPAPLRRAVRRVAVYGRRHPLSLLEGPARAGGAPLSLAVGGNPDLKDFFLKRAFAEGATVRSLGRVPVWWGPERVRPLVPGADLLFWQLSASLERLPRAGVFARLPAWLRLEIDLTDAEALKRGKEKFARIGNATRKAGFTVEVARTEAEFADFYDRMHLPYVTARHGEGASIEGRDATLALLRAGARELVLVKRGGEAVGGGTLQFEGPMARFWQLGVRDGDAGLMKAGVSDAVYHHVVSSSRERGYKVLHLGHTRPFVRDGVFEYKRMLGGFAAAARNEEAGCIEFTPWRATPGSLAFLADNPMVALLPGGRYAVLAFAAGTAEERRASAEALRERYCFKGTLDLRAFDLGDAARELRLPA